MSYVGPFERAFMRHTLDLVSRYDGDRDATLLLNCLLGLLIVPREACFDCIPEDAVSQFPEWGIPSSAIHSFGDRENANTLRGLVQSLRNSVAHFRFTPVPESGEVIGFQFRDSNGFHATITLGEMRTFVQRLSDHVHSS